MKNERDIPNIGGFSKFNLTGCQIWQIAQWLAWLILLSYFGIIPYFSF